MNSTLHEIKSVISSLPQSSREELLDYLLSTLQPEDDVKAEWLSVAETRMAEIRTGQTVGIPAEEVLKSLLSPES